MRIVFGFGVAGWYPEVGPMRLENAGSGTDLDCIVNNDLATTQCIKAVTAIGEKTYNVCPSELLVRLVEHVR